MEEKKTVLIVEDEKSIVDIVRFNLEKEGYATLTAYDGETGLAMALEKNPDIVLLDVMLPKMIGFDVCRILREKGSSVPVIILTAREEEADKVQGLEIGADDYITKPFSMRELMARVKANIRRTAMQQAGPADASGAMSAGGGLTINPDNYQGIVRRLISCFFFIGCSFLPCVGVFLLLTSVRLDWWKDVEKFFLLS